MGESALKQARKRINDLEIEVARLMIEVETERQLVGALVEQIESMVGAEAGRRNHRARDGFEWYE